MLSNPTERPPLRRSAALCLAAAVAAAALLLLTACGSKSHPAASASPSAASPLDGPEDTVKLYRNTCISCHGTELQGKMGPESDLRHVGSSLTKEQIAAQIENGGSLMPAFKSRLQPEQIDALAEWLASLK